MTTSKDRESGAFLIGERIALRPLEESDLARCARWMNDPELRLVLSRRFPVDATAQLEWFRGLSRTVPYTDLVLAIMLRTEADREREHVGNIGLHNIDWVHRQATTGIVIGTPKYRGLGIGGDAMLLLLGYAFYMLGLHRVRADVLETNRASQRCMTRCGFRYEGSLRQSVLVNGKYVDQHIYGILSSEWKREA